MLSLLWTNLVFSKEIVLKEYEKKIKNFSSIRTIIDKLTKEDLESTLRELVIKSRPNRFVGSSGHKKTRELLEAVLKELKSEGVNVYAQDFTPDVMSAGKLYEDDFNKEVVAKIPKTDPNYKRWKDFTVSMLNALNEGKNVKGVNYIWEKKGKVHPNEVIIIGANYDTLNNDPKTMVVTTKGEMPGADNNGTGVAMLINMIKIFNAIELDRSIRVVFYDFEELGFLGSKAFVENLKQNKNEKIIGAINLVMLGNDSKTVDKEKKFNNMKVYLRDPYKDKSGAEADLAIANILTKSGKSINSMIDFKPEANSMNSSSHIRFWENGIPALCFSQNWETDFNPRYHTSNDFVETINMNTFDNGFRYITGAILAFDFDIVK